MAIALDIYHQLPPWARNIAASLRGYTLNRRRYDGRTDSLVGEALERDYWSPGEWAKWQERALERLLKRASTTVPYYRSLWKQNEIDLGSPLLDKLSDWPVLEKHTLRDMPRELVADDCRTSDMIHENTSGTTGTSLDLWIKQESVKHWYALFEARCRKWYGVSRHDNWAMIGGQLVVPFRQHDPPFWVWNSGLNQLYLSAYHMSNVFLKHYLDAMKHRKVKYILGYTSAIYALAIEAKRTNYTGLELEAAITNAEPVFDYQRAAIEEAFGCPVRETYGMAEIAAAASECEKGNLHIWPDAGILEIDQQSLDESGSGDLLCTGLINTDMPLVRYRVGDRGRLSDESCECGRTLPLLKRIDGRCDDVLYTPDGRRIGRLDPVFKGDLPFVEAQIIQNSLRSLTVKFVPTSDFDSRSQAILTKRIRERMGEIEVILERVAEIPRTSRGKFRAVVCNVTETELANLTTAI